MDNYIIINKDLFTEGIKQLIKQSNAGKNIPSVNSWLAEDLIKFEKEILDKSILAIPEIEQAFNEGFDYGFDVEKSVDGYSTVSGYREKYINNLNLEKNG